MPEHYGNVTSQQRKAHAGFLPFTETIALPSWFAIVDPWGEALSTEQPRLEIRFRGRVIEHLGIDMYQSPVAAIAELISNAWDADSTIVTVTLPESLGGKSQIVIRDNGLGMTLQQCQDRYLNVGYNKRKASDTDRTEKGRPMMGRKGIGKFAGFGIASTVTVETVSGETGERTAFRLDADQLIDGSESYADNDPLQVNVLNYEGPAESRKSQHGTTITLTGLTLKKTPNPEQFRTSMARRFLLFERADEFRVSVNDQEISESGDAEKAEFSFPRDYTASQRPAGLTIDGEWGCETLPCGREIRWRFVFYKEPIGEEELTGVSVFSHHKLAQRPFFFNLTGGLSGQQGMSYLSGRIQADFLDEQARDLISTERQRVNWDADASAPLLDWGQQRVRSLLRLWQSLRADAKVKAMQARISPFSIRLNNLEPPERRTVEKALKAIARISSLTDDQFADLAQSMLSAWEGGRLKGLIDELANANDMEADDLVKILAESRVMSALHAAERVKAQLNLIGGLEERIKSKDLENQIRNYISENPWLIAPKWETFRVERSVHGLMEEVSKEIYKEDWKARVDLALRAGNQLLVIEFMRPGLQIDWDHLGRYERYVLRLRDATSVRFSDFKSVTGLLVADKLDKAPDVMQKIAKLRQDDMEATDWAGLLEGAKKQWEDYFDILVGRAPDDGRMQRLAGGGNVLSIAPDGVQ